MFCKREKTVNHTQIFCKRCKLCTKTATKCKFVRKMLLNQFKIDTRKSGIVLKRVMQLESLSVVCKSKTI